MPLTANKIINVDVDAERLTATISLNGDTMPGSITADQIMAEVAELALKIDEQGKKNIQAFANQLANETLPDPVVVAQGTPPQNDQPGRIEKLYEDQTAPPPDQKKEQDQPDQENTQSHYDRSSIITVDKGQKLLKLAPPVVGKDGLDVYGKIIQRKTGREFKVTLGQNVQQEGDTIIASCGGQFEFENQKAWVNPKLEIKGNVDFSVGNIDFAGEVVIAKGILDLFKVQSRSTIAVKGAIEAAEVCAGIDLIVTGGITGKEKGKIFAGNNIESKYITNAQVRAGQDVIVHKEIINCDLACKGRVTVENGPLVGGQTIATGGITVKQLGSEAGVPTVVEVGIDEALKLKFEEVAPEIEQKRRKAEKVKQVVEPLLQNQKFLNPEQKEKATELLYQAMELEESVDLMIEELRTIYQNTQEKAVPEIEVTSVAYQGVVVRFPRVQTTIKEAIKGPLKITPSKVNGTLKVIAVDSKSGYAHDLGASADPDDFWVSLEILLKSD